MEESDIRYKDITLIREEIRNKKDEQNWLIELKTGLNNIINSETKRNCKILKFSAEWSIEETISIIEGLITKEYPNLFIFIVETSLINLKVKPETNDGQELNPIEKLKLSLIRFSKIRPLVLQVKSEADNLIKIFYKEEQSDAFIDIATDYENFKVFKNFPTFMYMLMNKSLEDFESEILNKLSQVKDLMLILRFLRILNLKEKIFDTIILKIAEFGTKDHLLAALDISFENDGNILTTKCQSYISRLLCDYEPSDEKNSTSGRSSTSSNGNFYSSVLFTSIDYDNNKIFDYLISYCTPLIQQLPQYHQVLISTKAFNPLKFDTRCDLLELADFPFPESFKEKSFNCDRLNVIVDERIKFHEAIRNDNIEGLKKFTDNNPNLKIVYNLNNQSSLLIAKDSKSFKSYFYLKLQGFESTDCPDFYEGLTDEEKKEANSIRSNVFFENIAQSIPDSQISVNLLCSRSFINNRKLHKEMETEYRRNIRKWYEDINKIKFGPEILEVAASCESLKIIFCFENIMAENQSFGGEKQLCKTESNLKMIYIRTKLSDKKRDQQIKGILAREICHYVMQLIYENNGKPYYKKTLKIAKKLDTAIKAIDKWTTVEFKDPDDECNNIISSVYKSYNPEDFHAELIVRVINILAEFDDEKEKSEYLAEKYKLLFDFWETCVFPELKKFNLGEREGVRKMNRTFEILEGIEDEELEFSVPKNIKSLLENQLTIVTTNIPKLLLIDIHKYLQEQLHGLIDVENLFIDSEKLVNNEILNDLNTLLSSECIFRNIFIDCSKKASVRLKYIIKNSSHKFVLITSSEKMRKEIEKILLNEKLNLFYEGIKYKWDDLADKSQDLLLLSEINFQNNALIQFFNLFVCNNYTSSTDNNELQSKELILSKVKDAIDFSNMIDDILLALWIQNSEIQININVEKDIDEKFEFLFQRRMLKKKTKELDSTVSRNKSEEILKISQQQMLDSSKNDKFILISDKAGNGKSWMMKNFTKVLRKQNLYNWITFVDLKQFIKEFKAKEENTEFSTFFAEKILKPENKFELNIFKKLYDIGKVFILFDGFDEIAPDCTDSVINLFKSFQQNGGNQLWIATRDYFENCLQQELNLNVSYKLDEFGAEDGINFIVASWVLTDQTDISKIKSANEFKQIVKNSISFEDFNKSAYAVIKKIPSDNKQSFGLPLIFKMIADCFKNDENVTLIVNSVKIFEKFVDNSYERWAYENGQFKKKASIESQKYEFTFIKFHQYSAIESFAPELIDVLFPDYDKSEWPVTEIVSGGLMSKSGETISFIHETLREYFVAISIEKALKKKDVNEKVLEVFVKILTTKECEVIRRFLNDSIEEYSVLKLLIPKMEKFIEHFYNMENIKQLLIEDLKIISLFIFAVLESGNSEKVKIFIEKNYQADTNILFFIASNCEDKDIHKSFWQLLLKCFRNRSELKDLIIQCDDQNYSFMNHLVENNKNFEVVELTFKILKDNFTDLQLQNILTSLDKNKIDLLQSASFSSKQLQTYQLNNQVFQFNKKSKTTFDHKFKQCSVLQVSLLSIDHVKKNENNFFNYTNEAFKISTNETKRNCKILKFSAEWSIEETISIIEGLITKEYQNLFIFIVETSIINLKVKPETNDGQELNPIEKLKLSLVRFSKIRPLVLQVKLEADNLIKIFYKEEQSDAFIDIATDYENFKVFKNFPTFMYMLMNKSLEDFESEILNKLSQVKDLMLILRFLRILNLKEKIFDTIILKIAEFGTKDHLLAALDISFENDGNILTTKGQSYISRLLCDYEPSDKKNSTSGRPSTSSNGNFYSSVLFTSIDYDNNEIFDYLISYCTPLIQQLPQYHQVLISTKAFDSFKFDTLCDLLEFADFPFPESFKEKSFKCDRLNVIVDERIKFHEAIRNDNIEGIKKFTDNNPNLKIVYNLNNQSSLLIAKDSKSFKSYFYLKLQGFESTDCPDFYEGLTDEEIKEADSLKNANILLPDLQKSVHWLFTRSFLNNRKINKENEIPYRKYIRKWYEDINKIKFGPEILEVAASCKNLKIIFEFERETIENITFADVKPMGSTDSKLKMIFIGAKLSDKKREQQIKGVLAHEICHYVMKLVYENKENPFYEKMLKIKEKFEEVINTIDKWTTVKFKDPDDECNKIISSVYKSYNPEDFHAELIVRVINILAEFDDDEEKLKYLAEKYKLLFDFWEAYVFPELKKFNLRAREGVRKTNRTFELLKGIEDEELEFSFPKNIKSLLENQLTIVTTNIPKLLLIDIHKYLQEQFQGLIDADNLFIDSEKLNITEVFNDLKTLLSSECKLNVFIDCSKKNTRLKSIIKNSSHKFVLIISSEEMRKEIEKILSNSKLNSTFNVINYSWNDFDAQSKDFLLQTEINFQNNSLFEFYDLLSNNIDNKSQKNIFVNFCDIIDDNLLSLLVHNSTVKINIKVEQEIDENFDLFFQSRTFIEKRKVNGNAMTKQNYEEVKNLSLEELLIKVKNSQYVLISDMSGNGKSWMMKNLIKDLRKQNIYKWITFVDLKQFIKEFKAKEVNTEFSTFFAEKILKPENKFELNVFKKLYDIGKVFILFDGFDEIAPDCTDSVINLFKSFQQNGGNQLWIATRDYFENFLQQKLNLNVSYKLDEFGAEDGINFIVANWVLTDQTDKTKIISKDKLDKIVKSSPNFEGYLNRARDIVNKVLIDRNNLLGLPLMFKMIADGFKNDENVTLILDSVKIFEKFVDNCYERWAYEKGILKKKASIESQKYELTFIKFHQYSAIESFAPELIDVLFPDYDKSEWPVTEIVSGGLMSKSGETISFIHETIREYFVAVSIEKALKKKNVHEKILDFFVKVIKKKGYQVIRRFLNDSMKENSNLDKLVPKMNICDFSLNKDDSFEFIFLESLEILTSFFIETFKSTDYKNGKHILFENSFEIVDGTVNHDIFLKFQDFLFEFLELNVLKTLLSKKLILLIIFESSLEIEVAENFVAKVNTIAGNDFTQECLKSHEEDYKNINIFHYFCRSRTINFHRVQKFLGILEKFLTISEISELVSNCGYEGNILQNIIKFRKNGDILKSVWKGLEEFFKKHNSSASFDKLVSKNNINELSEIQANVDVHKVAWELLKGYFKNNDNLRNYIIGMKNKEMTYLNHLVRNNKNVEIIKVTLEIFKEYFTDAQFNEILTSGMILKNAVSRSKDIQIHKFLWKYFQNYYQSNDEFLRMLKKVDCEGKNILYIAAGGSSPEIINFIIEELEKIAPKELIKEMLSNECEIKLNLLQHAVKVYTNLENIENLWKIFHKYFDLSEISNIIKHIDKHGNNLLFSVVMSNNHLQVIELFWDKIKNVLDLTEQIALIKATGWRGYDLQKICNTWWVEKKSIKEWVKNIYIEHGITYSSAQNDTDSKKFFIF